MKEEFLNLLKQVKREGTQEVSPNWWPGNPNPQPGTEDWFFQHPDYGSNAEPHQADKCAQKAFDDAYIYNMTESIAVWVVTGSFSLAAFATAFGTSYAISYATCLYNEGVR